MINQALPDIIFKQLRDFIHEKCGIYISDTKKYLIEKKLTARLHQKNLCVQRAEGSYFHT